MYCKISALYMDTSAHNPDQGKTALRVKLHSFSVLLRKLANVLLSAESEESLSFAEPQIINRLLGFANGIETLESLEAAEGELFVSFLTNLNGIIQNMGIVSRSSEKRPREEVLTKIATTLKSIEQEIGEFLPALMSIDEERKETHHETFGGLLQKLVDTIQEKRHLIARFAEK